MDTTDSAVSPRSRDIFTVYSGAGHEVVFKKEPRHSILLRKVRRVARNITLEPVMLFMSIVWHMDEVSQSQMVIYKSCLHDFDFDNKTCDNLLDGNHTQQNLAVQNEVAQFSVYATIINCTFPPLVFFFIGSWSDMFSRKMPLYLYFIVAVVEGGMFLLNAFYINWPKEYLLFTCTLPVAITGGRFVYHMGINAFIAHISLPEDRSFRLAMMNFAGHVGRPVGTIFGAYLYKEGGFIWVFGATLIGKVIGFVWLVIRLECFKWDPKDEQKDQENQVA